MKDRLSYDRETGGFFWRKRSGSQCAGNKAGTVSADGYVKIKITGKMFMAHRLAWLFTYGDWPRGEIDHINGDRADNRISNLRDVSRSANQRNAKRRRDNTSGITGVKMIVHTGSAYWVSAWSDNDGVEHNKWFNIKLLGDDAAKQKAIAYRLDRIKNLGGYSDRHGT